MENSDYNVCPECGTENEPEYVYCKNCGTALSGPAYGEFAGNNFTHSENPPKNNFSHESSSYTGNNPNFTHFEANPINNFSHGDSDYSRQNNGNFGADYDAQRIVLDNIEGIPTDEMAAFVGSKAPQYIEKFSKMEISRSKVSWCWPAAILGFIFGPIGSAIWFLYRKMYKIAFILIAAGLIIGCVSSAVEKHVVSEIPQSMFDYFEYEEGDYAGVIEYPAFAATFVLAGMFSVYAYKRHAVKKISEYRTVGADPRYYNIGLHTIGGTSAGMAVLGVFIMLASYNLILMIAKIL